MLQYMFACNFVCTVQDAVCPRMKAMCSAHLVYAIPRRVVRGLPCTALTPKHKEKCCSKEKQQQSSSTDGDRCYGTVGQVIIAIL